MIEDGEGPMMAMSSQEQAPRSLKLKDSSAELASSDVDADNSAGTGAVMAEKESDLGITVAIGREATFAPPSVDVRAAATMMAADALHRTTEIYYQDSNGVVQSVWDEDYYATDWACRLRSKSTVHFLSMTSWMLIALTLFQHSPWAHPKSPLDVLCALIEAVTLLAYFGVFAINVYFMWGKRDQWHYAVHPWLTVVFGVCLIFNSCTLIAAKLGGQYQTVETIYGEVYKSPVDCIGAQLHPLRAEVLVTLCPSF